MLIPKTSRETTTSKIVNPARRAPRELKPNFPLEGGF